MQIELAERLGNTQTFVSTWERRLRRIDIVELVKLAEALGMSSQELLSKYLERLGLAPSPKTGKGSEKREWRFCVAFVLSASPKKGRQELGQSSQSNSLNRVPSGAGWICDPHHKRFRPG